MWVAEACCTCIPGQPMPWFHPLQKLFMIALCRIMEVDDTVVTGIHSIEQLWKTFALASFNPQVDTFCKMVHQDSI